MSGEKGSSKADTLVKVVLVFFISLLSFSVGTFVGKQVAESDQRRMVLDGQYKGDRSIASVDEKGEKSEAANVDKITDKEVESLTEEFVNKEKSREPAEAGHAEPAAEAGHAEGGEKVEHKTEEGYKTYEHGGHKVAGAVKDTEAKGEKSEKSDKAENDKAEKSEGKGHGEHAEHGKAEHAEHKVEHHPAHTVAGGHEDGTHKVTDKVLEGKAPSDGKKEERKPQSVLPSVAGSSIGKYTVQVASYADEKEAKTHAAGLHEKGLAAFYVSANVNGKTWFRVLVGLFDNMKSADEFKAQLMKDVGTKSAIVQKIIQ